MTTITVGAGERAVVRRDGTVETVPGPGRHRVRGPSGRLVVDRDDVRERLLVLPPQEVAAADVPSA